MQNEQIEQGYFYHIFNRGNNKEDIFICHQDYLHFLHLMEKYVLPVADVYAFCLLKNHFHLLVKIKDIGEITNATWQEKPYLGFSHLFNSYTQGTNKLRSRSGSLFQEHPKRIRIINEDYLKKLIVYIHLNPIKHGFSSNLNYPYSSYNAIISNKFTNVKRNDVISYFDDVENFKYWHDLQKDRVKKILNLMEEEF